MFTVGARIPNKFGIWMVGVVWFSNGVQFSNGPTIQKMNFKMGTLA